MLAAAHPDGGGDGGGEAAWLPVRAGDSVVLQLPPGAVFDRLWVMEGLEHGQKITGFTVEIQSRSGSWRSSAWPFLFPCASVGLCGSTGGGPQGGGDRPWQPVVRRVAVFNGTAVGHKRIIKLSANATTETPSPVGHARAVRLNITAVLSPPALLRSFAVFGTKKCA